MSEQKEKASPKTILELVALHDAWKRTFREGSMGNHDAYNTARDTRHLFEEEKWIPVKGLVDTLEILEERESKKIADLESSLEELSYSKEPEDKKLIAELMRTKSKHFGLMMAYVNIQGLVGVEAKKQK